MSDGDLQDLQDTLEERAEALEQNIRAGLVKTAMEIAGESMENYVTEDTGFLKWSHFVSVGNGLRATVGVGARYGAAHHELHNPFLTNTIKSYDDVGDTIKTLVESAMEKGQVIPPTTGDMPDSPAAGRAKARSKTGGES